MVVGAKVCDLTEDLLWFVCGLYVGILMSPLILMPLDSSVTLCEYRRVILISLLMSPVGYRDSSARPQPSVPPHQNAMYNAGLWGDITIMTREIGRCLGHS